MLPANKCTRSEAADESGMPKIQYFTARPEAYHLQCTKSYFVGTPPGKCICLCCVRTASLLLTSSWPSDGMF